MRYLFFTLLLFIPFTLVAEYDYESGIYESKTYQFYLNEDSTLCYYLGAYTDDSVCLEPLRDTILVDGQISQIYYTDRYSCQGYSDHSWIYMRFPDGVDMLHPCRPMMPRPCYVEFHYPTGLKPGLYNLAEDFAEIVRINTDGTPVVAIRNKDSLQAYYSKLYPTPEYTEPEQESASTSSSSQSPCSIQVNGKTIPLYGRVEVVSSFGDIKVQVVSSFPDLRVKETSITTSCGEWEFVNSNADFTIEYVSSFPDLKIEFVSSFPGIP